MAKIIVIGLGPGDVGSLTLDAVQALKKGHKTYLRTEKHLTVDYLIENRIEYEAYDYVYEQYEDFDEVYSFITKDLVKKAEKYDIINYCVPGHPLMGDKITANLMELKDNKQIEVHIVGGMSFIEPSLEAVGKDLLDNLHIVDSLSVEDIALDINSHTLMTQIYDPMIASEIKLHLIDLYGDDYEVYVVFNTGLARHQKVVKVPLYEIDHLDGFDHLTTLYIPKVNHATRKNYNMYNLLKIMEELRGKNGCPWDIEQTHESLRQYVLEEAYEVVDAIDKEDYDGLAEELGDLLLQVVFHSTIGNEEGYFNIWDIVTGICRKLIHRHPHVFKDATVTDVDDVLQTWNAMKAKEKGTTTHTQRLMDIPKALSALSKSYKVQARAADVGFDWPDIHMPFDKLQEEIKELTEAIQAENFKNIEEELGDVLFSVVNVSRFLKVHPEVALNQTINKFIERFKYIEEEAVKKGKSLQEMPLNEMDDLWNKAKIHKNLKFDKKY